MKTWTRQNSVEVDAPKADVWARVTGAEGINYEMWPWMTMTMPHRVAGLTIETLPLNRPVGRAWLRAFGIVPFDYDHLTVVEVEPGVRFLERSTMLSMRRWEHERTLTPIAGGTLVHDRVSMQPRLTLVGPLLAIVVNAFFKHRQRRLRQYFSTSSP